RSGQLAEGLASLKRGHELGSKTPGWPYPSADWLRQAEELVRKAKTAPPVSADRVRAILKGMAQPADTIERLALAQLCRGQEQLYAAAARFYAEAFTADPKLAADLKAAHRYAAARAAALASVGQGKDADGLDEAARAR